MKTFAIFLLSKETFTIRTCSILESFFRKLLSKATFERKLSSVYESESTTHAKCNKNVLTAKKVVQGVAQLLHNTFFSEIKLVGKYS